MKHTYFLQYPKQHSQMGPSQAHPGPIWGPTLPNWGPTGAHMECCLGCVKKQLANRKVPIVALCTVDTALSSVSSSSPFRNLT